MKTRVHVIVEGKVQGVFFRQHTKEEAQLRNLKGWIRNLPDGRVEAIFEGESKAIEEIIEFCKTGPRNAYVTKIDIKYEEYRGEFDNFKIEY